MIVEGTMGKDMKESGCGLIEMLYRNLSGGTGKNHEQHESG
jgi:hypothetical protein